MCQRVLMRFVGVAFCATVQPAKMIYWFVNILMSAVVDKLHRSNQLLFDIETQHSVHMQNAFQPMTNSCNAVRLVRVFSFARERHGNLIQISYSIWTSNCTIIIVSTLLILVPHSSLLHTPSSWIGIHAVYRFQMCLCLCLCSYASSAKQIDNNNRIAYNLLMRRRHSSLASSFVRIISVQISFPLNNAASHLAS